MFSRQNAKRLRELLPDLNDAIRSLQASENHELENLTEKYLSHYRLKFSRNNSHVQHFMGKFESNNFSLVCQYYLPKTLSPSGTAFLLHGYYDHTGIYGNLIRYCLDINLAVVIFDMPGHGLSSGKIASIDSFEKYTDALIQCAQETAKTILPQPWHLIGQSTGAAVILDYLLNPQLMSQFDFDKKLLLGPLLRPKGWAKGRIIFLMMRRFVHQLSRKFSENSSDWDFLTFLRKNDQLQSKHLSLEWLDAMMEFQLRFAVAPVSEHKIHIIQGSNDGTVDWQYNLPKLHEKFPAAETHMIENARHHLINESEHYLSQVFAIMDNILIPRSENNEEAMAREATGNLTS